MGAKPHVPIEEMEVFRRFVEIADWAWEVVSKRPPLARNTVGEQLVRALDRVGATLVEGDGRYSAADAIHFFIMARASARESRYWLHRARTRKLIPKDEVNARIDALTSATQLLNNLIAYRRSVANDGRVREPESTYEAASLDPFTEE